MTRQLTAGNLKAGPYLMRCSVTGAGELAELRLLAGTGAHRGLAPPESAEPAGTGYPQDGMTELQRQLEEYFLGTRREFDVPLAPEGTEFQLLVWRELQRIPCGTTITYGELARRIGRPDAVRAVGAANGANPIWIIIPCHRVIGADGSLTGYAGGIEIKRRLLELEGAIPASLFDS